ncbi:MAG: SLOG family protein [Porcipelethomonas sp.]
MKSACFTGHRILSGNITALDERLYNILERGINNLGLTDFYAGGAIGWDTLSAQTVLKLREIYPFIKLHLILPCSNEEQTIKWTQIQKDDFQIILSLADTVEYTAHHYYNGCMKVRNARLVECATDCCFCFWNPVNKYSRTAQTVRMAHQKKIMIVNFYTA